MFDRHLFVITIDLSNLAISHVIHGHNASGRVGFVLGM
jgi:hypothetical protein